MNAGPEMDALVATQVMGWTRDSWVEEDGWYAGVRVHGPWKRDGVTATTHNWKPSENIAHAWEVVEKMRATNPQRYVSINNSIFDPGWIVWIDSKDNTARHESLPLAICRAALQATTPLPERTAK